jgi:hypothetical protein
LLLLLHHQLLLQYGMLRWSQLWMYRLLQLCPAAAGACRWLQHSTTRPLLLLLHQLLVRAAASAATKQRQLTGPNGIAAVAAASPAARAPYSSTT